MEDILEFIEELKTLCNLHKVVLVGCDCGGVFIEATELPIEDFNIDFGEGLHLAPQFAERVLAA